MFSNRDLRQLILPLVIEQILVMLVGIADTVMVSYIGESAISGVALVDMLQFFIITVLSSVATGGAVIVSQYIGNKQQKEANLSASQLVMITALISSVIMALCLVFYSGILALLFGSVEEDVMSAAATYFVITAYSIPFLGLYNSAAALYRSMQNTNVTMYVSLLMNVVNIAGNAIGIFVLNAGVAGAAVPTLVSRAVAALLITALAFRKHNIVFINWKEILGWHKDMIRRILRIAVPNGIENGLFAFGKILVVSIIALFGTSQIAANGVSNSVNMAAIVVVTAVNLAMITVVGQCVGAKEYGQASRYTKKLMMVSYIATGILTIAVFLAMPFILCFYELSEETYALSVLLINLHNIMATFLHPTSFNLSNSLRAAGDVRFTMYTGILSMLIFRLGTAVVLGILFDMGILGVWIAMGTDWLARSAVFSIRYLSGRWKNYRAI